MAANAATYGIGWTVKQITIREIDPERTVARCVDTEGQMLDVSTAIHRTGIRPQVGQVWLIDRTFASWTLCAFISGFGKPTLIPASTTPWEPVETINGWVPSASETDPKPAARLTADGWIELSGVIYNGPAPTVGQTLIVAKLPAGFPPSYRGNVVLGSQIPSGVTGYVRGSIVPGNQVSIAVSQAHTPTWIDLTSLRTRIRVE
ncbi:hypothetical protein [Streptomyces sp. NPDC059761]|uniref:hypothetical protein n=1 Tax=Streptomyces sp. NPDC059761 TaxID=3346937 RepID=UPI00365E6A0A